MPQETEPLNDPVIANLAAASVLTSGAAPSNEGAATPGLSPQIQTFLQDTKIYEVRVDLFKHLGTIASGSVVVLTAFGDKIPRGGSQAALICAVVGLVLTIVSSAWLCFYTLGLMSASKLLALGLMTPERYAAIEKGSSTAIIPAFFFIFSLIALGIFVLQHG